MRCVLALSLAFLGILDLVTAAPRLVTPLAAQQPPVARVDQDFVFSVLPASFTSDSTVTYAASGLPQWLQFSPANPTFYGKPTAADVGEHVVTLTATDSAGTANSTVTLIVSNYAAPVLTMDFDRQIADPSLADIASAKVMPGGHGVSVPPFWSFALGWNGNMFKRPDSNGNGNLFYTAHVRGTTGLPDWLTWSNTTFTFNGVAPANGSYEVVVTATDYWNYTAASSSFVFSVGDGAVVENSKAWPGVKTTARSVVSHTLDLSGMLLNGDKLAADQVEATPDLANVQWLSYDKATRTISGTTPDELVNGTISPYNIPVTLSSANSSNTLSYVSYLNVSVLPYAFTAFQLPTTNIVAGQTFQFDISKFLVNQTTSDPINATVIPGEAADWLLFHPDNYTLVGTPPANLTYTSLNITFQADSGGATSSAHVAMPIDGVTGPEGNGEPAPIPNAPGKGGLSKKNKIIIGVVVGVGGFLILLALILCCCCLRKRDASTKTESPYSDDKEGTPETLVNSLAGKKSYLSDSFNPSKMMGDSPRKYIKGLFGTVNEPSLPTVNSKDSAFHSARPASNSSSFMCAGELIASTGPNVAPRRLSEFNQASPEAESLASWESQPSMHWSGEDEYLEPLYERDGFEALTASPEPLAPPAAGSRASQLATPTFGATPAGTAIASSSPDSQRNVAGPSTSYVPGPEGDIPRPRAGFVPSYPRWINKGDRVPPLSSDDVSVYFSEFDQESDRQMVNSRSLVASRSLDSFAAPGSEVVGTSSGSRLSRHSQSATSNPWWRGGSNMSSLNRSSDDDYSGEAVVATAQRHSLDTQRSSLVPNEVIEFTARDHELDVEAASPLTGGGPSPVVSACAVTPTTPDRPLSYLVVPSYVHPMYSPPKNVSPRRHSSSRRMQASASPTPTRNHILRGEPPAEVMYSAPLDQAGRRQSGHL